VHCSRPLGDQPRDEAPHATAPDDLFDVTEEAFPTFDRPLWRPQIRFIEDEMQRLLVRLVKRLSKGAHETPAGRAAAQIR
jgi:hypothetical protein